MLKRMVLAACLAGIVGCGDGGSSPVAPSVAPDPTSPPPRPPARVSLTIFNGSYVAPGEFSTADVYFDFGLRETAGTGFNVLNLHLDIYRPNGQHVERRTFNRGDIARFFGGNYIEGGDQFRAFLIYAVRTSIARGSTGWFLRLTARYQDDNGNIGNADDAVQITKWGPL